MILLKIQEIFNVYVQKESGEIYHHVTQPFQLLEQETQELFLANFKKMLTGQLDAKLFELKFKRCGRQHANHPLQRIANGFNRRLAGVYAANRSENVCPNGV